MLYYVIKEDFLYNASYTVPKEHMKDYLIRQLNAYSLRTIKKQRRSRREMRHAYV